MIQNPKAYWVMPVGIVLRRTPGISRWQAHSWHAAAVLPGAGSADWRELRREGEAVEFHAATVPLELHGSETEAYQHGLQSRVPSAYVVLRRTGDTVRPLDIVTLTVSPYEAQDYTDNSDDLVEAVAMPPAMVSWVRDFVEAFHEETVFVKRRRDRRRVDLTEDGVGDVRIAQPADVYRAPSAARKVRMQ